MRWLLYLAFVALMITGAILGPLVFSVHQPAAANGSGQLVYRSGSYVMRFTDEPCPFDDLDLQLQNDGIPPAKAYRTLTKDGRWAMPGCYAKDMGGDLTTLDTAGNQGTIPQEWLSREP